MPVPHSRASTQPQLNFLRPFAVHISQLRPLLFCSIHDSCLRHPKPSCQNGLTLLFSNVLVGVNSVPASKLLFIAYNLDPVHLSNPFPWKELAIPAMKVKKHAQQDRDIRHLERQRAHRITTRPFLRPCRILTLVLAIIIVLLLSARAFFGWDVIVEWAPEPTYMKTRLRPSAKSHAWAGVSYRWFPVVERKIKIFEIKRHQILHFLSLLARRCVLINSDKYISHHILQQIPTITTN